MAKRISVRTFAPSRASVTTTIQDANDGLSEYKFNDSELEFSGDDDDDTDKKRTADEAASFKTLAKSRKSVAAEKQFEKITDKPITINIDTAEDQEFKPEGTKPEEPIKEDDSETGKNREAQSKSEEQFDPNNKEHVANYHRRKSETLNNAESEIQLLILKVNREEGSQYSHQAQHVDSEAHTPKAGESMQMRDLYSVEYHPSSELNLKTYLTVFEALALSTVLEELYLQLELLGHSFPGQFVQSEESDFLTYDERFALEVSPAELIYMPKLKNFKNPFIIDETQIGTKEERMAHKMQKDRAFLQEIIRLAKDEIDARRTFETLKDNVSREDGRRHEEITLMEREKKAKQNVRYLRKKIGDFREQMERDEHNRKELINHLKDQVFQEKQNAKMDARYTRATLDARNTFNYSELNHLAELDKIKTKELEVQMTRDRLAHRNIEAWSVLMFLEIEGKINDWKEKFDSDLEDIDKRIRNKQDTLRTQQSMIEELNKTIEERMIELGPWEAEKEQERQERIAHLRLYYSARKIQRWWRAFMVKHNLYKKRKGKKGGGKGKGKKGGGVKGGKIAKKKKGKK